MGELIKRLLHVRRIARATGGGKKRSSSVIVVVGDGKGKAGFGQARSTEAKTAIESALAQAEKNMMSFKLLENRTIHSDLDHRFLNTTLELR